MATIAQIDKNLAVPKTVDREGLVIYDPLKAPFSIHGVLLPDEKHGFYYRVPIEIANATNEGVAELVYHTAGGRIRFATNSKRIAVFVSMDHITKMSHFALTGSAGLDLYADGAYKATFIPPYTLECGYESCVTLANDGMKEIEINLPIYSGINEIQVGLDEGAELVAAKPYRDILPVVYYGSSITQGGCASRPGSTYQSIIARRLSVDFINLGFSGSAKGEEIIGDYIASLDMGAFVLDYDFNTPSPEHLKNTHERMFLQVRKKHPTIPIIIVSKPVRYGTPEQIERFEIIKETYDNAIARGDENVYLINMAKEMCARGQSEYTVDGTHPTDYGFKLMADIILEILEKVI